MMLIHGILLAIIHNVTSLNDDIRRPKHPTYYITFNVNTAVKCIHGRFWPKTIENADLHT